MFWLLSNKNCHPQIGIRKFVRKQSKFEYICFYKPRLNWILTWCPIPTIHSCCYIKDVFNQDDIFHIYVIEQICSKILQASTFSSISQFLKRPFESMRRILWKWQTTFGKINDKLTNILRAIKSLKLLYLISHFEILIC